MNEQLNLQENYEHNVSWGLANIWNQQVISGRESSDKPRNRIWATELAKAPIDTFYKLKGEKPSNPYDPRSLRKFQAGNIWEGVLGLILMKAGIYKTSQQWVGYQYPKLLEVSGKLDFTAGGKINWVDSIKQIQKLQEELSFLSGFSSVLADAGRIVESFAAKYPNGMDRVVIECKSASLFQFERRLAEGKADREHRLQAYHYLKGLSKETEEIKEAHILYVSKDDTRLLEFGVRANDPVLEEEYKSAVEKITYHYKNDIVPDKEKEVEFDELTGKYSMNWKVMYSPYLTKIYGYENQNSFDQVWRKRVSDWNRVMGRIAGDKKMTAKNDLIVADMKNVFGLELDKMIAVAKAVGATEEEENE